MLILTTHGELDDSALEKRDGVIENDHERTAWVEYWLNGELVHRSVYVTVKQWPDGLGAIVERIG